MHGVELCRRKVQLVWGRTDLSTHQCGILGCYLEIVTLLLGIGPVFQLSAQCMRYSINMCVYIYVYTHLSAGLIRGLSSASRRYGTGLYVPCEATMRLLSWLLLRGILGEGVGELGVYSAYVVLTALVPIHGRLPRWRHVRVRCQS